MFNNLYWNTLIIKCLIYSITLLLIIRLQDYKDLKIYLKADKLVLKTYNVTQNFPKVEMYVLTSQIRRSAISICSNIVEGCGRNRTKEFKHFLEISLGSTFELAYQIELAFKLNYVLKIDYDSIYKDLYELRKMLYAFIIALGK